jgi:hypothetical protein
VLRSAVTGLQRPAVSETAKVETKLDAKLDKTSDTKAPASS